MVQEVCSHSVFRAAGGQEEGLLPPFSRVLTELPRDTSACSSLGRTLSRGLSQLPGRWAFLLGEAVFTRKQDRTEEERTSGFLLGISPRLPCCPPSSASLHKCTGSLPAALPAVFCRSCPACPLRTPLFSPAGRAVFSSGISCSVFAAHHL